MTIEEALAELGEGLRLLKAELQDPDITPSRLAEIARAAESVKGAIRRFQMRELADMGDRLRESPSRLFPRPAAAIAASRIREQDPEFFEMMCRGKRTIGQAALRLRRQAKRERPLPTEAFF